MEDGHNVASFNDFKNNKLGIYFSSNSAISGANAVKARASIAERRAVKCGFNVSKIHLAPLDSPARSPCFTFSPGVSPTALLDSAISLPNANSEENDFDYQALAPVELPMDFEFPPEFSDEVSTKIYASDSSIEVRSMNNMFLNGLDMGVCSFDASGGQIALLKESIAENNGNNHPFDLDQKATPISMGVVKNADDGYNWRKYGQKQVKGSEYPRSYYKCTHPSCQVKKKVERSYDGQITEIVYKGSHNHPKLHPGRRVLAFPQTVTSDKGEGNDTCVKVEGGSVWRNIHSGSNDIKTGLDSRGDGLERTSSASVLTEIYEPLSMMQGNSASVFESPDTPEFSSTLASQDDDEDRATQGSLSLGDDTDDLESYPKRLKTENSFTEANVASRAVRAPRIVVQIESEVDILDDGYRWRKYGQKVVKGNPNPRY